VYSDTRMYISAWCGVDRFAYTWDYTDAAADVDDYPAVHGDDGVEVIVHGAFGRCCNAHVGYIVDVGVEYAVDAHR